MSLDRPAYNRRNYAITYRGYTYDFTADGKCGPFGCIGISPMENQGIAPMVWRLRRVYIDMERIIHEKDVIGSMFEMKRPDFVVLLSFLLFLSGCATAPYRYGQDLKTGKDYAIPDGQSQIERGRPNRLMDWVGWVVGIPAKVVLWNRKMDNHRISEQTEQALKTYLEKNQLDKVKVRINQYAPIAEWKRLFRNKSVGWGWRYSLGVVNAIVYTILPGRIFGGDNYNPFSNTVSIYSDVPAVLLHEGGHAKDVARKKYKGIYAALYIIPGVPLWHEAVATGDAIGYYRVEGTADEEKAAYKILYPAYGSYVGGTIGNFIPKYKYVLMAATVVPGHIAGRMKAARVDRNEPIALNPAAGSTIPSENRYPRGIRFGYGASP